MISLIIPVYNEAENIQPLVEKIKNSLKRYKYEVIFINDGSYDETEKYFKKIIKENRKFSCVNFKRNYGQTAALQAGFDYSSGKIVVAMDGDLQNNPEDISTTNKKNGMKGMMLYQDGEKIEKIIVYYELYLQK